MTNFSANIVKKSDEICIRDNQVRYNPLVLVHGWTGSPEIWCNLIHALTGIRVHYFLKNKSWEYSDFSSRRSNAYKYPITDIWPFDYSDYSTEDPKIIAENLMFFIKKKREETGYQDGKIDIVCHSMGALVTRYYMEVLTDSSGEKNAKQVRQWIGICPVNHGVAIANMACLLPQFLHSVFPSFIGFTPSVSAMRTNSKIVRSINQHPIYPGTVYRSLVGYNSERYYLFRSLPLCFGQTIEAISDDNGNRQYNLTYFGDGVLALAQSYLEGAGLDCFRMEDHSSVPRSQKVIETILKFLHNPDIPPTVNWPEQNSHNLSFNPENFLKRIHNPD